MLIHRLALELVAVGASATAPETQIEADVAAANTPAAPSSKRRLSGPQPAWMRALDQKMSEPQRRKYAR
jgi:hypothetical protein